MTLFAGTSIAQAIPFLVMPILSRIYADDVDIFGLFFLYSSIVMVLGIVVTLKYEIAIVLPEKEEDAINFLVLSLVLTVIISGLLLIAVFFLGGYIAALLDEPKIKWWLMFLPLSTLGVGVFQSFSYWNNRHRQYKRISYAQVSKSVSSNVTHLGIGFSLFKQIGLIPGVILGQLLSALHLSFTTFREIKPLLKHVSINNILKLAVQYKDIPLFNSLSSAVITLSADLPIFLLTRFYGGTIVGYYGFANKVLNAPLGIFNHSVSQVFYREATEVYNRKEDLLAYVKKIYRRQVKIGIIPFALIGLLAPWIFVIVFGEEWKTAGIFAQIATPWLFLAFLNQPISYLVTILNKQKEKLFFNILLIIARFFGLYAGYAYFGSAIYSIGLFVIVGVLFNLFFLYYFLKISGQSNQHDNRAYSQ